MIHDLKSLLIPSSLHCVVLKLSYVFGCRGLLLELLNGADCLEFLISSTKDLADIVFEVVNILKELFNVFLFVGFIEVLL
jgi:hypothetical protein